jgi:hypothetical protein
MDNSETVFAFLDEPIGTTFPGECFPEPDFKSTPCAQSCGSTSYSINGFQSNEQARELSISVSFFDQCSNPDMPVSFFGCATVPVPPATWTRVGNTVTVKAETTLKDCGFFVEDGGTPPANPMTDKKITIDLVVSCKKLSTFRNKCRSANRNLDGLTRSRNMSFSEDCSVKGPVGTLTVDGVKKQFQEASFGRFTFKDVTTTRPPRG